MAILECEGVSKVYRQGENTVSAVKDCYFEVEAGEFVAIVGASGSGKSTLLSMLGGLERPSGGKVWINGCDIYSLDNERLAEYRRKHIGFIFQSYNLIPVLTALENILMPVLLDDRKINEAHVKELLTVLGIADRIHHLPSEMSGGQQQRVAVARALVNYPTIVLADEPTGNLDKQSTKELMKLLLETKKLQDQTLVMVTHDDTVAAMADKIYRMDDGWLKRSS